MSKQKDRGTAFETALVRYLREQLDDDRIERRAPHGSSDMGDVFGIRAHGWRGIAECKDYARYTDYDLGQWMRQTLVERDNADADFAMLVVHRRGKSAKAGAASFGKNVVWVTVGDLMRMGGLASGTSPWEDAEFVWVSTRLEDAVQLMLGVRG